MSEPKSLLNKHKSSTKLSSNDAPRKSIGREIAEIAFIALILVPFVNAFVLQSYAIPTPSMEGSMLVGDKLFVSKLHYGPRIPMTPLALPYAHDKAFGMKSYSEILQLPYKRLPGLGKIDRGDVIVFNYPGDYPAKIPVDKRTNYVKRCVAEAGDSIALSNGDLIVNGQKQDFMPDMQHLYIAELNAPFNPKNLEKLGIGPLSIAQGGENRYGLFLTDKQAENVKKMSNIVNFERKLFPKEIKQPDIYPQDTAIGWNLDNFGPLYLPKRGDKIKLDQRNYSLYQLPIREYENNPTLTWKDGKAYIKDQAIEEYEFKMNYYFAMGDNRENSLDSRYWGMVPEDHIVGTPVFVWLSTDPNASSWAKWIRWGKSFRLVH